MTKRVLIAMLIALIAATAFAVGSVEITPAQVVTTTSWTAAFAEAAGAESVRVLAPYDVRHPPEYELAPSDIQAITDAELVIFAGYERMVARLQEAIGEGGPELLQITTTYGMEAIEQNVMAIAAELGTTATARREIDSIAAFYASWREDIVERGLHGKRVICHAFQAPLAMELGLEVAGTFGPAPLEAVQISTLSKTEVDFIIDNWHNDVGKPLTETMPSTPVVTFINFPGRAGTRSLLDVLQYNREVMAEADL